MNNLNGSKDGVPEPAHLTWVNIAIGLLFLLLDASLSIFFQLGLSVSLLTAAARCVLQLTVMGFVLQRVFETNSPWAVAGITCLLILLGTIETVVNKSKRRFQYMFPSVLLSMLSSAIPVSILGTRFAMGYDPWWQPAAYIPVVGMLCGNTISAIVVSTTSILRDVKDNRDKVEMYLAFGGSRWEACKPIATDALRLALTPTLNQMSVIGLISIPGMMTGAILGGSSVEQAARLQMVIMFLISAATALAAIMATGLACAIVVDEEQRIRDERVSEGKAAIWVGRDKVAEAIKKGLGFPGKARHRVENGST
ncbi:hypothetical protein FRC19_010512 [Serendipita sp. 401]|nr:hypothetical protein FRC19_010512 [Serendipita sp. 401]KAG8833817.1 hypothetical protein FRC18_003030 [Serendipita sp. 400]KAG9058269.1 hypothetical protein FS842_011149 [Serendipita sp. 407]